jgi:hypothetical protein
MRKIILMMSVSLDGFFEGPNRELDWHLVTTRCTVTSTSSSVR